MRENGIDGPAGVPFLFVIRYILGWGVSLLFKNTACFMTISHALWKNIYALFILEPLNDRGYTTSDKLEDSLHIQVFTYSG